MERRKFSREFKISVWCVSVAQASRDIYVHENLLRNWV
jgi:transposase-like protein